jgi:hypothetical protein
MAQKPDRLAALRSAIGQQLPSRQEAQPATQPPRAEATPAPVAHKAQRAPRKKSEPPVTRKRPEPATEKMATPRGRGVQFYLDEEDRKYIRDLALWFASQDKRVSDSQVIKILVRGIRRDSALLELCDKVRERDRRREKRT